jgi:serine/threonine protein kinase
MARIDPLLQELLDLPDDQRKIGPYFLVSALSRDKSAPIWRAEEKDEGGLGRAAAVKLFSTRGDPDATPEVADRKRRQALKEARALHQINHPNVVRFHEIVFDEARRVIGIGMEFIDGTSLEQRLARGPLSVADTVSMGIAISAALGAMHSAGLVHRDIKPANIIESAGVYKLVNFGGVAPEQVGATGPGERRRLIVVDDLPLDALGTRMGELDSKMLRSQAAGGASDGGDRPFAGLRGTVGYADPSCVVQLVEETTASDLYSLGATLFRCLTGMVPAAAAGEGACLKGAVLAGTVPAPTLASRLPGAPKELAALLDALLDPQRDKRPASAPQVEEALKRITVDVAKLPSPVAASPIGPAPIVPQQIKAPPIRQARSIPAKYVVAGTALLLVGGGGLYSYLSERQIDREINDDWSRVSMCLMGAPIKNGETASLRVHNIRLTADGAANSKDPKQWGGEWPLRCAAYARNLRARLEKAERADKYTHDLAWHLEPLAQTMETGAPSPAIVDQTWIEAAKLSLVAGPVPDVPSPPAPAHPLTSDALKNIVPLSGAKDDSVDSSPSSASGTLTLLVGKATPKLCTITEKSAHCVALPKSIASTNGLRLMGDIEEGADPLLAIDVNQGENIGLRIYRASGEIVAESTEILGAVSRADGTASIVARGDVGETIWTNQKRGEKESHGKTKWPYGTTFHWGLAFFAAKQQPDDAPRWYSSEGDNARLELGKGVEWPNQMCRTATGLIAYGAEAMAVYEKGKWSAPVEYKLRNGALSCVDTDAGPTGIFSSFDDSKRIEERCSRAGCERVEGDTGPTGTVLARTSGIFAGRTAIAWSTPDGAVKVRVAKLRELAATPLTVAFDGAVHEGAVDGRNSLQGMQLYTCDRFAVLLLSTTMGTYPFRLGTDGALTPLAMD